MPSNGSLTARHALEAKGALKSDTVAVRVDGRLFDLHTPLPEGAEQIEPVQASDSEALPIIRHSSAHVMADAVQRLFPGTQVTFGPATDTGFYYDFDRPAGPFSEDELRQIERKMADIIGQDLPFRREVISKQEASALLRDMGEHYKLEHLERLDDPISLYRHGDWVDLCKGPHVPSTRFLRAFRLTTVSGAYWRGDERNPMLQRIYGTAFASEKELRAYLKQLEEAKKRDHRKLGKELGLIAFHPWAPASPFFLPRGATVYNALIAYVQRLYRRTGYEEIITPQVFDATLFRTSGHLPGYGDNMYMALTAEDAPVLPGERGEEGAESQGNTEWNEGVRFGLKPMNCPGHCLVFGMSRRSYRELPLRLADFGRLHRYERSGVVQGLTRVRTFCQDDAHIFCTMEQVQREIQSFLSLVDAVYRDFGFTDVRVVVATRPDARLGSDEVWDRAEKALCDAAEAHGVRYEVAEGEGAFYGPKIEFHLKDALGRDWQLGTIQADFNLPERFDLAYVGEDNAPHRPVMLHRAVFGSIERFFGVLVEHVGGAFPTWLAPEQVALLTVSERFNDYAQEVATRLRRDDLRVVCDLSAEKLGAKIRKARLLRIPYLAVIGEREQDGHGVSLRSRDENRDLGFVSVEELCARLKAESLPASEQSG